MPEELEVVGVVVEYGVRDEIIELSVVFAFVSSYSNRTFPAARKLILSVIAIEEDWGRPKVRFCSRKLLLQESVFDGKLVHDDS